MDFDGRRCSATVALVVACCMFVFELGLTVGHCIARVARSCCRLCGCLKQTQLHLSSHTHLHLHLLLSLHALLLHCCCCTHPLHVFVLHTLLHALHMHVGHKAAPKEAYEHEPAVTRRPVVGPPRKPVAAQQPAQAADSSMLFTPVAPGAQQAGGLLDDAVAPEQQPAEQQVHARSGAWAGLWSTLLG